MASMGKISNVKSFFKADAHLDEETNSEK